MRVISLGWGVQSWALCAMSALGELPKVDAAIHADTTHERAETYKFAERWTPWLEKRGVQVVTVKPKHNRLVRLHSDSPSIMIPAYTCWLDGRKSGTMRRQCTDDWKIAPVKRWLQASRMRQPVEQWLGITQDEASRAKKARVKYITNVFPLIDSWTRSRVEQWLQERGLEVPVKSSCVFCPYHNKATWGEIQRSKNGDWEKAVAMDETIRRKKPGFLCYLLRDRKPLSNAKF